MHILLIFALLVLAVFLVGTGRVLRAVLGACWILFVLGAVAFGVIAMFTGR